MNRLIRLSRLSALICVMVASALPQVCLAQDAGGPSPQPGPNAPAGGTNQPNPQPSSSNRSNRSPSPDSTARPIFLSGSVRLTDGTLPPESVSIERVCNGRVRREGYTDSKGNFSFLVGGQPSASLSDASVGLASQAFGLDSGLQNNVTPRDLNGCEIRAYLAGFQSTAIVLTSANLDAVNLGVLHLSRLANANNVDDFTFSTTTATAPKDARSAYDRGLDHAKKQKWADAERDFLKAVQAYPHYAIAWYELGRVYQQEKKFEDAERALTEAIGIDPRFISPYGQLTFLAAVQGKWDDVIAYASQIIRLSPAVPADVYFYSSVAHYNLRKIDVARDHARQAATLDTQHRNPQIPHLLGMILAQTGDYNEAAEQLRLYLKLAPNSPEAAAVEQKLAEIDKAIAERSR